MVLQKMSMASNLGILCFGIQALVPLLVSSHAAVSYTFMCACVSYICSLIAIAGLPALSLTGLRTWGSQLVSGFRYNTPIADNLHFLIFSCIFLANPGFGFLSVIVVLIPALCALASIAQARSWTLILPSVCSIEKEKENSHFFQTHFVLFFSLSLSLSFSF